MISSSYQPPLAKVATHPVTLVVWTNLPVSLDDQPTANTIMLKVLDQIYVQSPLAPQRLMLDAGGNPEARR
jgi:D-alanyl-D-alanine carboxypeptidase